MRRQQEKIEGTPKTSNFEPFDARRLKLLLCIAILLYIPIQWLIGKSPGSTSIFSPQRSELKREFRAANASLQYQLVDQCRNHDVHSIYFADSDVISPYLVNKIAESSDCKLYRETDVTPIAYSRKLACSAIIVDESLPDAWNHVHHWQNMGELEGQVIAISDWESEQGLFGFKLLKAINCVSDNRISGAAR